MLLRDDQRRGSSAIQGISARSMCRSRASCACLTGTVGVQARPTSAGRGLSAAAAQEAALAAAEEEWSARLAEALALCQDQEAALEALQQRSLKDRRCSPLSIYLCTPGHVLSAAPSPQSIAGDLRPCVLEVLKRDGR